MTDALDKALGVVDEENQPQSFSGSTKAIDDALGVPQGDDVTEALTESAETFGVNDALEMTNLHLSSAAKGLYGLIDMPVVLTNLIGNVTAAGFNKLGEGAEAIGLPKPSNIEFVDLPLPVHEGLKPERFTDNQELIEATRPSRLGLEFFTGGLGFAQGMKALGSKIGTKAPVALPQGTKGVSPSLLESSQAPGFMKQESILSGISGSAATVGSVASDGDPLVELGMGVAFPMGYSMARNYVDVGKAGTELIKHKFSSSAMEGDAVELIIRHADDPKAALVNLDEALKAGKGGSVGVLTRDKGVIGFEKLASARTGGDFNNKLRFSDDAFRQETLKRIEGLADEGVDKVAQDYLKGRIARAEGSMQAKLNQAAKTAKAEAEHANTPLAVEDASVKLDKEIAKVLDDQRTIEKALWSEVPDSTINARGLVDEIKANNKEAFTTSTAKSEALNPFRKEIKLMNSWLAKGDNVPIQEFIDLRSSMMETLRNMKQQGTSNRFAKKFVADTQGALLNAIDSAPTTSPAYREAAAHTKKTAEIFTNTAFDSKDDISQVLSSKVFRSGDVGAQTADELKAVQGLDPNGGVLEGVDDVIKSNFVAAAVDDSTGVVDATKGKRFLKKYVGFLERHPETRQAIEEAVRAQKVTDKFAGHQARSQAHIDKSLWKAYSDFEDPIRAVDKLVSGSVKEPTKAAQLLMRTAQQDKTGKAVTGLQRNVIDSLVAKLQSPTGEIPSSFLKDYKKIKPALDVVYKDSPDTIKLIDDLVADIGSIRGRKGAALPHDTVEHSLLVLTAGKIMGARVGAKMGTSPLIAAGLGGKLMEKFISITPKQQQMEMVEAMLLDPQKFQSIVGRVKDVKTQEQAIRLMNAWALNAGIKSVVVDKEVERQSQERQAEMLTIP